MSDSTDRAGDTPGPSRAIITFPKLPPVDDYQWGEYGGPLVSIKLTYEDGTQRLLGHNVVAFGAALRLPPEPSPEAVDAALNIVPERAFAPAFPYGGAAVPCLSRNELAAVLRAAYAVDGGTRPDA